MKDRFQQLKDLAIDYLESEGHIEAGEDVETVEEAVIKETKDETKLTLQLQTADLFAIYVSGAWDSDDDLYEADISIHKEGEIFCGTLI
jgi:formate dehydrogenase assembly factor FdhD